MVTTLTCCPMIAITIPMAFLTSDWSIMPRTDLKQFCQGEMVTSGDCRENNEKSNKIRDILLIMLGWNVFYHYVRHGSRLVRSLRL